MDIKITPYKAEYKQAFKTLNKRWIDKYFVMEEADYNALDNPESYIINKGGQILYALHNEIPVGVCALIKLVNHPYDYELAKMAVMPKYHGQGIGKKLAYAIIKAAKEAGGQTLFLESNTILEPAIKLYRKIGFIELEKIESPYERSNIHMVLKL